MTVSIERGERLASLVRPAVAGTAGVLLLPSVFGVDRHALDYAHLLAEAGLTTLIWEPFPHQPVPDTREQRAERLATLTDARSLREMTWWLDVMFGELSLKQIATAGFCLGGRYGLLLAAHEARIAACLPYYPTIETPPLPGQDEDVVARAAAIRCPVHMVRAGKDHLTSDDVFMRLQHNLQRRAAPTIVQVYPEGDHGFMQRTGAANETAIRLSTAQSIAFLKAALDR
ncbi:MAG: dienelactone hydrolase family protein [Xanthobacteraceae bacterium]